MQKDSKENTAAIVYQAVLDTIGERGRILISEGSSKRAIPYETVEALLDGIFLYFSQPTLRRRSMDSIHTDTLGRSLLACTKHLNPQAIANAVPSIVALLQQHPSPIILQHESVWLGPHVIAYASLPKSSEKKRAEWLRHKLRGILYGLNRISRCTRMNCKRQTATPNIDTINSWARSGGAKDLQVQLLAYFHKSTPGTVRKRIYTRYY